MAENEEERRGWIQRAVERAPFGEKLYGFGKDHIRDPFRQGILGTEDEAVFTRKNIGKIGDELIGNLGSNLYREYTDEFGNVVREITDPLTQKIRKEITGERTDEEIAADIERQEAELMELYRDMDAPGGSGTLGSGSSTTLGGMPRGMGSGFFPRRRGKVTVEEVKPKREGGLIKKAKGGVVKKAKGGVAKKVQKKAKGGAVKKKQGSDARLDESLGERQGKESTKSQSFKSRRKESRGASKPTKKAKKAAPMKKQGSDARLDESLGERRGKESTKSQSFKSRRNESRGASKPVKKASKPKKPQSAGAAKRGWGAVMK